MTAFVKQTIAFGQTLGEKLRRLREEGHWAVADVARELRISPKYVSALEESRYHELPGEIYTRQFLRSYATLLQVEPERVLELYEKERGVTKHLRTASHPLPPRAKNLRAIVTTGLLTRFAIIAVILGIVGYLGFQVYSILAPPELTVTDPPEDLRTQSRSVIVAGTTEPEATVFINGSEAFVDREGYFEEVLTLPPGTHVLRIVAERKRSRPRIVTRAVFVEELAQP